MGSRLEFARRPHLHDAVGVIVGHQLAIGRPDRLEFCIMRHAEYLVGIIPLRPVMAGTDAPECALAEAERLADIPEELHLCIRHHAVSAGNLEQPVQHAFEQAGPVPVFAADAPGIAFIAADGLAGDVEDAADIVGVFRCGAENAREDHDFLIGDGAIGHCKLGPQPDNRSGKPDIIGIRRTLDTVHCRFGQRIRFKRAVAALKQSCPQTHLARL